MINKLAPKRIIKAITPYGALFMYRKVKNQRNENRKGTLHEKDLGEIFESLIAKASKIDERENPRTIVSLTTYGHRIAQMAPVAIASIFNQTPMPDKVILWLSHDEKPSKSLQRLAKLGLDIRHTDDIKSYKKLIPTLKEYPESNIITADDDVIYPIDWLEKIMALHRKHPESIIFNRGRKILTSNGNIQSYLDWPLVDNTKSGQSVMPTGIGGVLYPPHSLSDKVLDKKLFTKLAPHADDLWFWAMAELIGTNRFFVKDGFSDTLEYELDNDNEQRLSIVNVSGGDRSGNDAQLVNILGRFPELCERLEVEPDQTVTRVSHNNVASIFNVTNRNDWIQKIQRQTGTFYEIGMLQDIEQRLSNLEGCTIVDAGAYIGNHTVFFATHCHADKVISFEPFRASYNQLLANVKLNNLEGIVQAFDVALGEKAGKASINVLDEDNKGANEISFEGKEEIDIVKMDTLLLKKLDRLDVMKVDVEGMEISLLKGALKTIDKFSPLLYIEAFEQGRLNELINLLSPLGYGIVGVFNATPTYLFERRQR
jgi:protein O-GlcNAc transferase